MDKLELEKLIELVSPLWASKTRIYISCGAAFLLFLWTGRKWRQRNYPPRLPGTVPVIGDYFILKKFKEGEFPFELMKIADKINTPIFRIRPLGIFTQNTYYITDYDTMKEVFVANKGASSDRFIERDTFAIATASGNAVQQRRKAVHQSMRKLGLGKSEFEDHITMEAESLIDHLKSLDLERVSFSNALMRATTNVICSMAIGRRYEYTDQTFIEVFESLDKGLKFPMSLFDPASNSALPAFVRSFFRKRNPYIREKEQCHKNVVKACGNILEGHRKHPGLQDTITRDFLDAQESNPDTFSDRSIKATLKDLFFAGSDTTSLTLEFCILHMTVDPALQHQLHQEIKENLDDSLGDLSYDKMTVNLPKLSALIHEVLRYNPVAPTTLPHKTTEPITLKSGMVIPAHSRIFGFTMYIHRRSPVFKDPAKFHISNFLSDDGKFEAHQIVTFGVGPRSCIGEKLARVELMIFLVYLIKTFKFLKVVGETYDFDKGIVGATMQPKPFLVKLVAR